MMACKVAHLTSVHPRYDTRVFLKMCTSLVQVGYEVFLVVADGAGDEIRNGVNILDVGKVNGGRISRMTKTVSRVFQLAKELDADVYHLHDPELMPIGLKLKKEGFKVVFDAHEDFPQQLKSKPYLNKVSRYILSLVFERYEKYVFKKFDALIGATPVITQKLSSINGCSYNINNYPILGELNLTSDWASKSNEVCYLGGVSSIRGIKEIVSSLIEVPDIRLNLAGRFTEKEVEVEVKSMKAWHQVNELGFIERDEVASVLSRSKAGIVTFHAYPNHVNAQPNKMFEYMSAGLPIITSNFPMWKEIVEHNNCGICVNPEAPEEIASAIDYIVTNPVEAFKMGVNGLKAVTEKYNWTVEEKVLLKMYGFLLK